MLDERHQRDAVALGDGARERDQVGIGLEADTGDGDGALDQRQRAQQHVLVLAARHDDANRPVAEVAEAGARRRERAGRDPRVHPPEIDAVGDDDQPPAGVEAATQGARDRRTHGDGAVRRGADHDELDRRGERHRAPGDDEAYRQPPAPAQPRERPAIARRVTVHHVDPLARDDVRETRRERAEPPEVERHDLEAPAHSEPGQQRLRAAAYKHTVAARREVLAQVEDGLRRSRTVALVGHLQDGERGVSHERTRTRALLPIHHLRYKAYFRGFTAYVSQTRSSRPARAHAKANEARQNSCTCPGLYVGA